MNSPAVGYPKRQLAIQIERLRALPHVAVVIIVRFGPRVPSK